MHQRIGKGQRLKYGSDETAKDLDATNENLERAEQATNQNKGAIDDLEQKLKDMMERNAQLEKDLARYKSDTDRVGENASDINNQNYMNSESIPFYSSSDGYSTILRSIIQSFHVKSFVNSTTKL